MHIFPAWNHSISEVQRCHHFTDNSMGASLIRCSHVAGQLRECDSLSKGAQGKAHCRSLEKRQRAGAERQHLAIPAPSKQCQVLQELPLSGVRYLLSIGAWCTRCYLLVGYLPGNLPAQDGLCRTELVGVWKKHTGIMMVLCCVGGQSCMCNWRLQLQTCRCASN